MPHSVSLAARTTSSSSSKVRITATGPEISACISSESGRTSVITVGG